MKHIRRLAELALTIITMAALSVGAFAWLHVLKAMRVWCVVSMLLTPLCTAAAVVFEQATGWQVWCAVLIGYIASLFGAIVIPAKKYQ